MNQLHLHHLLWRTGFGPAMSNWKKWENIPEKKWWSAIKESSAQPPQYFDVADSAIKGLMKGIGEAVAMERKDLDKEDKKKIRKQSVEDTRNLNLLWLEEMVHSGSQLREKMALFWHGHFASRNLNILYEQDLLNIIRSNALDNFGTLLKEVSKSAAMIAFLNNQQNKKQHPNENFAREVMELFTLGRGNYTEHDVKEAARAFTGWSFRLNGDFVFRERDHDDGEKTVLGKSGRLEGDDVLDILLAQRQTARFIARKLYRFMVNHDQIPGDRIQWLGDRFYDSGYKIMSLLDDIMQSDWFYAPENIGCKIKSPIELWAGIRRAMPLTMDDPESQLMIQKILGQTLFNPPNVAGWPGGKAWIDSSSLMLRLRLPQIVAFQGDLDMQGKSDDDQMMGQKSAIKGTLRKLAADVDWQPVADRFSGTHQQPGLVAEMAAFLWQRPNLKPPSAVLEKYTDHSTPDKLLKTTYVQLMATPEYQLC
jgi:uncharacterized protein (DUF1800 family)